MNDEDTLRTIRPNLVAGTALRGGTVAIGALALGAFLSAINAIPFAIEGGILLAIAGIARAFLNLRTREYRFHEDKVEVYEGFLNIEQNTTSYDRITDTSYSQPVTQRLFGTGTIKLNTAGSRGHEIKITYINNPENEYRKIKQILNRRE